jgi:hypothetical protein
MRREPRIAITHESFVYFGEKSHSDPDAFRQRMKARQAEAQPKVTSADVVRDFARMVKDGKRKGAA